MIVTSIFIDKNASTNLVPTQFSVCNLFFVTQGAEASEENSFYGSVK